jgi:two-component system cell cycle sensor histidine kinase/response regulator CckA
MSGTHSRATGTILLAEDETLLRELSETILTQAGHKVLTAPSLLELKTLLAGYKGTVDLLLTDVTMPEMSGPELARLVKKRWPDIQVLYVSGYPDDEIGELDRGDAFLQKPFTPTELMAKVSELLGNKAASA